MMNGPWAALGVILFSLILPVSWSGLKQKWAGSQSWQNIEEQWFGHIAQFFYFVGIPYCALTFGVLTPRLLGLTGLEHFILIDWNSEFLAVQMQQALTLMLLEWLMDSHVVILTGMVAILIVLGIRVGLIRSGLELTTPRDSVLMTVYYGLHWAFYRAIFWSVTGDLYLGVVLGIGFVMLEWALLIWTQKSWQIQQQRFLTYTMILILSATVFFYGPNLWLLWPIHLIMVMILSRLRMDIPLETRL
jgi:hypothetical protein